MEDKYWILAVRQFIIHCKQPDVIAGFGTNSLWRFV